MKTQWQVKAPGEHGKGWRVVESKGHDASGKEVFAAVCDISTSRSSEDNFSDATENARAHLIAAAPSLLKALENCITSCISDDPQMLGQSAAERLHEINALVRAAIAKANGGQ